MFGRASNRLESDRERERERTSERLLVVSLLKWQRWRETPMSDESMTVVCANGGMFIDFFVRVLGSPAI